MTNSGPAPKPAEVVESYDLVVVGGGISGLAAAYFYRQKTGKSARMQHATLSRYDGVVSRLRNVNWFMLLRSAYVTKLGSTLCGCRL